MSDVERFSGGDTEMATAVLFGSGPRPDARRESLRAWTRRIDSGLLHRISRRAMIVGAALLVVLTLKHEILGPSGYLALRRQRAEYQRQRQLEEQLQLRNRELHSQIQQLKSDPEAIEHIAREELHLARPGEVIYTYNEANTAPAGSTAQAADAEK
jgi:cell division protein FtsB